MGGMTGFPPPIIKALKARSKGLCEGCGIAPATEAHHRQYRSRGGAHTLENALHLCGGGNHSGCHGQAHTLMGEQRGWSIRSGFDPLLVPWFRMSDRAWFRFTADGLTVTIPAVESVSYMESINAIKTGLVR